MPSATLREVSATPPVTLAAVEEARCATLLHILILQTRQQSGVQLQGNLLPSLQSS